MTTTLRYGGDEAFAPFESLDAQGRPRGFQIDLLAALGSELGVRFDIALKPWAETEADFLAGRLDLIALVETAQRQRWARFTRGHATPAFAIYHRPEGPRAQALSDLVGLRVAVLDGDAMRGTLAQWLTAVPGPFVRVPDAGQALAAVQRNEADVALLPRAYADPLLGDAGVASGIRRSSLNLTLQTYAFGVAPQREDLQAQLQRGLDTLEADGRLEALRMRWLSSHRDVAEKALLERDVARNRRWTWGVGGASGAALLLMGGALWLRGRRVTAEQAARVQAEAALRQAQELLDHTFARHADPMLIVERGSGIVRDANPALLVLFGAPADAVIGRALSQLEQHIDAAALQPLVESLAEEGALDALPLQLRSADGQVRQCLVSADALLIDNRPHVFCIVRDVTAQLQKEADFRSGYEALSAQLAQAQRERDAAREEQRRAQGELTDFTRSVTHDLKAPLGAVAGFAGLLRDRLQAGRSGEAMEYLAHIERAAQRMKTMVTALARLGQVSQHPLRRHSVDMQRLVMDTFALIAAAHPARRTAFGCAALPPAQADPELTAQVWQNLLDNAAKYSARVTEPKVAVDSFADERGTWYRVTDNGAGFEMARATRLFLPFQRMHSSSQFEGTGVGLSVVRRIVDHHGGDIRISSTPGVGTVVEFTLDAAPGQSTAST